MDFFSQLKVSVIVILCLGWFSASPVLAQNSSPDPGFFVCRCPMTSNCSQPENWSIVERDGYRCSSGFMPDPSLCWESQRAGTTIGSFSVDAVQGDYALDCVAEPEVILVGTVAWGEPCVQENQKGECADVTNTCRMGADNFKRCLKDLQSVPLAQGCRDISECSDRGEDVRCRNNACSEEGGRTCSDERPCSQNGIPGTKICTGTVGANNSCTIDPTTCGVCNLVATNPIPPDEDNDTPLSEFEFCQQINDSEILQACNSCYQEGENKKANMLFTAVGCINVSDDKSLAADIIKLLLGVSGGIALLSLLAAGFLFTISQADTGKIKEAKELATASVSGILFIIFSVIVLSFVGVDILKIPGLG